MVFSLALLNFRENLSLKLISLLLAALLEVYFLSPENKVTISVRMTGELRGVPSDMVVLKPNRGASEFYIDATFKGPRNVIDEVRNYEQRVYVNYPKGDQLKFMVKVPTNKIWMPTGVKLERIEPEEVEFELDLVSTKSVKIEVPVEGEVSPGYHVAALKIVPDVVTISGPRSVIEGIETVKTSSVDISRASSPKLIEVAVPSLGAGVTASTSVVRVSAEVLPIMTTSVKADVPVTAIVPKGYAGAVTPSKASATITGPADIINSIGAGDIQLLAIVRDEFAGVSQREVKPTATLPDLVKLVTTDPERVTVRLTKSSRQ
jgi:YbbR domain-containing protein